MTMRMMMTMIMMAMIMMMARMIVMMVMIEQKMLIAHSYLSKLKKSSFSGQMRQREFFMFTWSW